MSLFIDHLWDEPFAALASNGRIKPSSSPTQIPGAYIDTHIEQPDDRIIFGVEYDLADDIAYDTLPDDLYLGALNRSPHGVRLSATYEGQTIKPLDLPVDLAEAASRMQSYLRSLLSESPYSMAETLIDDLHVDPSPAEGHILVITIGVPTVVPEATVGEVMEQIAWPFYAGVACGTGQSAMPAPAL